MSEHYCVWTAGKLEFSFTAHDPSTARERFDNIRRFKPGDTTGWTLMIYDGAGHRWIAEDPLIDVMERLDAAKRKRPETP